MDKDNNMNLLDRRENKIYSYQLLDVLEFNSTRKRMSLILKDNQTNTIILYSKGADNIIYKRLTKSSQDSFAKTNQNLQDFSNTGLRTLLLAQR